MKVKMVENREGGWFEGGDDVTGGEWRSYPPVGAVLEVSDQMGADMCSQGVAVPVTEERKAETRPAPDTAEKRAGRQRGPESRAGTSEGSTAG